MLSDGENYFWCAGQNDQQAFSALSGILSPCQTIFLVANWQITVVILVFYVFYFYILCVLNPAGQNVRQGLRSLPYISRSLPDMSGNFAAGFLVGNVKIGWKAWQHGGRGCGGWPRPPSGSKGRALGGGLGGGAPGSSGIFKVYHHWT